MKEGKRILIVEDEPATLKALSEKMEMEGFIPLEARNGGTGLTLAMNDKPDLILLDIVMPVMDGMTMLKKLRASSEWGKKVPVIILTNLNADDRIMGGVISDEPAYYLVKTNWTLDDVVNKVRECLERAR